MGTPALTQVDYNIRSTLGLGAQKSQNKFQNKK